MDRDPSTILQQIFPGLAAETLAILQEVADEKVYPSGTTLCRQGRVEDTFYIILDGEVEIVQALEIGQERRLEKLGPGRYFGEMGLLDEQPRAASVVTRELTRVLEITGDALVRLMASSPAVAYALTRRILAILRTEQDDLVRALVAKEMAEHELAIGRRIQNSFLPRSLPEVAGWDVATHFESARQVAGDFYDLFELSQEGLVALVIADVCDKGVGAALYMALFRSLIHAFAEQHYASGYLSTPSGAPGNRPLPESGTNALQKAVSLTNEYIVRHHGHTYMFVTLFFAVLDPRDGWMEYINAGHEPPLLLGPKGIKARLQPTGPVVGIFPEMDYRIERVRLEPGDFLLAYTDGVTEAQNAASEFFGRQRLYPLLAPLPASAGALLQRIAAGVHEFDAGMPQWDDITMVAVRRLNTP